LPSFAGYLLIALTLRPWQFFIFYFLLNLYSADERIATQQ